MTGVLQKHLPGPFIPGYHALYGFRLITEALHFAGERQGFRAAL
jgi:hypothetical protein